MSNDSGPKTYFTDSSRLASSNQSSDTKSPKDTWSVFGDDSCGEPMFDQHLVLDFTPNDDDSDFVQNKVCSFWQFINNHPEIQNLKVKPEKCDAYLKSSKGLASQGEVVTPQPEEHVVNMNKTACSMLEIVEKKDLISRAFEGRMPRTNCSLRSLKEEVDIQQKKRAHGASISTKPSKSCLSKQHTPSPAKIMCKELKEWDDKHSKSMDPPAHAVSIQHCKIQRQIFKS